MKKLFFLALLILIIAGLTVYLKYFKAPPTLTPKPLEEEFIFYVLNEEIEHLKEVKIKFVPPAEKQALIKVLFEKLKEFPLSAVNENIRMGDVFINEDACLINLNLSSKDITRSAFGETALFYSIVNTITKNTDGINYVKFIINGRDMPYLEFDDYEGHIALDVFLKFNGGLVK